MTNCKNCNRSLEPTENDGGHSSEQRQKCQDQYLTKIAKKWGLIASITFTIFFVFGIGQMAIGQEWDDASVTVNGKLVSLSMENPTFVQAEPNSVITGNIHTTEPENAICTLESCTSTTASDSTLSGFDEKFTAIMGNDTNGEKFQVLNGQNVPTYTIVFMNPPSVHTFQQHDDTPLWQQGLSLFLIGAGMLPLAIVGGGIVLGAVFTVRHIRNAGRNNRGWRT
jgi:hypothetical protein